MEHFGLRPALHHMVILAESKSKAVYKAYLWTWWFKDPKHTIISSTLSSIHAMSEVSIRKGTSQDFLSESEIPFDLLPIPDKPLIANFTMGGVSAVSCSRTSSSFSLSHFFLA